MSSFRFFLWSMVAAATIQSIFVSPSFAKTAETNSRSAGWIDVTAPLDPKRTPIYPGDAPLKFSYVKQINKGDMLDLSAFCFGAHSGTHVDAPAHFIAGGATTDQIPLEKFIGRVRVVDCDADALAIDLAQLNKHDWKGTQRVFFRTRNSRHGWMTDPVFHSDFTYLAPDAAKQLADSGVQLVGVDYISAEKYKSEPATHRILLGKGIPIVEGLLLDRVEGGDYDMMMLPMNIVGHEGAPVRALIRRAEANR